MSKTMKEIQFAQATYEQWQEEAVKALKGKPFESLLTKTNEGITLQPLYTQATLVEQLGEQLEKQVATIRTFKHSNDFEVAQAVYGETSEQFLENLKDSLARGNEVINVDSRTSFTWDEATLQQLADFLTEYSFKLTVENDQDPLLAVFNYIEEEKVAQVEGYVLAQATIELPKFPKVRTAVANTTQFHNEGAHAVQELGLALAIAAEQVEKFESFEAFASKFFVSFAIDTQFFTEIAKLRAFKVLWKAFSSAYSAESAVTVPVVAETSLRSFSKVDVYVNLLRAGNEAFAGLIGGADVFTVHPHDVLSKPSEQSIRIARNVLLVLKEETVVTNVIDPAGGSYFIESLTADLVKEAWAYFLTIQEAGGFTAYEASGQLEVALTASYEARIKSTETRKQSLIGTNIYANPADEFVTETNPLFANVKRLAIPFETLRAEFTALAPKTAILTIGQLKNFKPRADFVAGFLNTVGVVPEQSGAIESIDGAKLWLASTDAKYVVVVATDDDTKAIVSELLNVKPEGVILDVAGKFKDEQDAWLNEGLNGFIFAGQNIIEKLNSVLASIKEVQ